MAGLTLTFLGGFEASLGEHLAVLPTKKARALLAYLVMNPNQRHSREKMAGLLWGDSGEEQARANLRQTLTAMRHALPQGEVAGLVIHCHCFGRRNRAPVGRRNRQRYCRVARPYESGAFCCLQSQRNADCQCV